MKAAAALAGLALAASGCRPGAASRPPGPVTSTLFAVAAGFGTDADATTAAFAALQDIARRVEQRHRHGGADIAVDLNAVVFGELGFEREIQSTSSAYFTLPTVLASRRGSCLGLAALYLAIAERVGVPLDGILLPGHFFVRTRGAGAHNVELLRRGEAMPDAWYRNKYGPWPDGGAYLRPVTATELAAIHWYNRGNDLRGRGELVEAERALRRAAADFPGFAEAQASLGSLLQLRGALNEAAVVYRAAAQAWPDLPGLTTNVELLRRQVEARP